MPLEENVALFERGMELSNACKGALATAESRVRVLLDPKERGPVRVEDLMVAVEADDDLDDEVEIGDDEE
jgi:exodeoxyribonuclease VII small subunit